MRIGFLVNPVAGIGGAAGQHGSDSPQARAAALALGYAPAAMARGRAALDRMGDVSAHWLTGAGDMGERLLRGRAVGQIEVLSVDETPTTAATTRGLVRRFMLSDVDAVVFVGGDGTARDVVSVTGDAVPVLGIPAGVKMRSGCFAVTPAAASAVLGGLVRGDIARRVEAELLDAAPDGAGSTLFGYCTTPAAGRLIQSPKSRADDDEADRGAIADEVVGRLGGYDVVVCGPGRGAQDVLSRLGARGTLLGVDVLDRRAGGGTGGTSGRLTADVDERTLFAIVHGAAAQHARVALVVGVVGGQGILFGRGNQQLSPRVVAAIGWDNVILLAGTAKLAGLQGHPLLIDWDADGAEVPNFVTVVIGRRREARYRLSPGAAP